MSSMGDDSRRPERATAAAGGRDAVEETERELLRRVARGDRVAFEAFYRRFARRVGGYLFKLLRQHDLAEEALDDTMLVVWEKAHRFDGSGRVSTWLFGIAHRKALKAMERSRRHLRAVHPVHLAEEASPLPEAPRPSDPEEQAYQRDRLRRLARGIEQLPPEQRAVVELTFLEGRSYGEIAEVLGCPVNTVKTRMFHARRQLGRHLEGGAAAGADARA